MLSGLSRVLLGVGILGASIVCVLGGTIQPLWAAPLSPGDTIRVVVNPDGSDFSGLYLVGPDGNLDLPYLPPLPAAGEEASQVQADLAQLLVNQQLFRAGQLQVAVTVVRWAPIRVAVAGAVFYPGQVLINEPSSTQGQYQTLPPPSQVSGAYASDRYLTAAILAAGGVTPYADVHHIELIRAGHIKTFDLSGAFTGQPVPQVPLEARDQIFVPTLNTFQDDLVRPSDITLSGVRVFLSNLTVPATSNSGSAINAQSTGFSYGSRFSQAVVSANCTGGTPGTNAGRRAVLVHTDRLTGKITYTDRSIQSLIHDHKDDDTGNPFLMEGDGVACYDSRVSTIRDVFRALGDILNPFDILRNIITPNSSNSAPLF